MKGKKEVLSQAPFGRWADSGLAERQRGGRRCGRCGRCGAGSAGTPAGAGRQNGQGRQCGKRREDRQGRLCGQCGQQGEDRLCGQCGQCGQQGEDRQPGQGKAARSARGGDEALIHPPDQSRGWDAAKLPSLPPPFPPSPSKPPPLLPPPPALSLSPSREARTALGSAACFGDDRPRSFADRFYPKLNSGRSPAPSPISHFFLIETNRPGRPGAPVPPLLPAPPAEGERAARAAPSSRKCPARRSRSAAVCGEGEARGGEEPASRPAALTVPAPDAQRPRDTPVRSAARRCAGAAGCAAALGPSRLAHGAPPAAVGTPHAAGESPACSVKWMSGGSMFWKEQSGSEGSAGEV